MKKINLKLDMELDLVEIEKEPVLVTAMNYGDAENITKILTLKNVKENEHRNIFRNRE